MISVSQGPRIVLLHAAEDGEFVRRLVEKLMGLDPPYDLPQTDISCQQVTGTPGDVSRAQLTSTLTLGSVKLVVPVISRHLLADQSSLTVGLETAVRNNKPRYVIWLDQNKDGFREFGTLVSRQYPTLEAPARRVQRDRVEEMMPFSDVWWMEGIAWDVRDALCRQTGELRYPCWKALVYTREFLADNMNLPAVLTRLEQENQLSPAEVRDIQAEPTPVSRGERLVDMLWDRRRQEPYDWLVRVLREEGQDFLLEEMEEQERHWERIYGIGEQQAAQPGQQTAQGEHFTQQSQDMMQKHIRYPDPRAHTHTKTPSEVKCVILGLTEAGKTSLLNCMMKGQGHVEAETNRTIGVDVVSYDDNKNNVKYGMYDFGGHQIYHYTHRFFLTRQALHILNVDLPEYKSEEFQERVGTWLTSVTSHVFNPAILVVGTKVDLFPPDKTEEMIAAACSSIQRDIQVAESKIQTKLNEEIRLCQKAVGTVDGKSDLTEPFYGLTRDEILAKKESLEKLLDGRPKGLLNVQVIPVSSKTFQGIEALCDKMAEMVKDGRLFPAAHQELPTSWTKLSENIKTSGRPYLHVRDCQDVGAAAGMKESDVLNALSYLHVTGQILFYNHIRGMEDLVFSDPTIILTLFKQIFRHDLPAYLDSIAESLAEHTRAQFTEDRASFLKTGRASDSFMKNLLGENIVTFNSLLPLMKHFGLCYSGSVIFPTELPAAQPGEVASCWPEVVPSGGEEISVTIEYSQEPPLGLPETMVSRILSMEQTTRRLLTKDTVIVHVGENSEDVMYRHFPTREEIRIRGEPEKAWRQAQTVAKVMEACRDEFPALYFSNSVGSGETTKSLTIEAVRRHVPGDLLRMSEGNWERPLDTSDVRTPDDVIGKYFIDNRLYQVSRAVGEKGKLWTRLGQELGLNRAVLNNITYDSYTQEAFQMLKKWRTKTPHGPLHYLPQLEETLQNMGKPDLAAAVQRVYKEYRDALPLQEVSPEMTGDTQWSLRLPGEGKYLCRRTDLGVVTPYPLHVTYRSANWSDNWQQDQGWMPVGPLFSIQCEDVEGPVDILLPHVLCLNQNTVPNPDAMGIVHVTGETEELLTVSEISPTHLTTRFRKGSKFGPVVRTVLGMSLRRNGLCVVFAPANFTSVFQLHVYIISNVVLMVETLEGKVGYSSWDPEQCVLKLGEEYQLEVTAKNGADVDVQTRPEEGLEFDDTFDTGQYYKKFRVEVDARKYSRAQRSRLRFDMHLKNADQTVCRFIPTKGAQTLEGPAAADDSDSGVSEPDGADADTRTSLADSAKRASRDVQRGVELPVTIETLGPTAAGRSVLLVSTEYGTSKGGVSTINRQVAHKLSIAGAKVYATVLETTEQDERDAERDGVKLLKPRLDPDSSAKPSLEWLTVYHSVHFPHIPSDVCCIVGNVDVTSRAARKIREERFPHAKLAMFGHVAPEETEHYKSDEKALGVGRKEASIQDDIDKADVVFSVGPRIHRHYDRFLRQRHVTHHIFLPEPSKVFSDANVTFGDEGEVEKPKRVVLSIGRVRNVEMLKGHDLAAGSIDKAAQRLDNQYKLRLRVRGIDENDFKDSKRILEEKLRSGRVKPTLLPYGTQEEIRRDMEACHLVLMPSRAEPFGLVGLEAIAAGVPVLISEQSGLAELVAQLAKKYQPNFRHCIVKMKGDTATDADAEKWADSIEDVITNAKSVFAEARAFREKLLASKYWEESHQKFLQACGITGPCVVLLHAAEDGEFVRRLVEELVDRGRYYSLPKTDISCQQVTGTPGDVSRAQLTSTLTLGSLKLVVPVISRHLLADQSSLKVGLETAVRNNKPRYVIWLDQNKDDFREFGTLVSRQYPTLEAPARRVQRDRLEETMPGSRYGSGMEGIACDVSDALCRQTGELRLPCLGALEDTREFLADNLNLPAVLTRLEQENQLSPADVRDIQEKPTPVSRGERLVMMLRDRRRQEPYDWLVRVLREEGQDFLAEEMEEWERHWERIFGIGEQQAAQPGQQTAQREHFARQSQEMMQKHLRHPDAHAHTQATTPSEVKCVILGQTEAGKTSLLNCMMKGQGHVETETNRTIGVDVITYHDTRTNVKYEMYDFGGHQIYHYTHRFFLTRQALHILNVDLPGYKSEEFQERVGTWLTSVTSHVFNPAILVVGTKVDLFPPDKAEEMIAAACSSIQRDIQAAESKIQTKLNEEIQLCQKAVDAANGKSDLTGLFYGLTKDDILAKKESLEKLLDGRPKGLLNVQVLPVSSKTFQGIEALCDKMAEMVKDERLFPAARQELPTSWTKLSENIKTSGRPYLHVKDCQDVGAAAGMKESDVLNALIYLHVTGQILFYNHIRGMEDLVFPDPTIILTLFKQMFRHDLPAYLDSIAESLFEHTRAQFAEDRESFLKTGRASDSFIKNLLGDDIATFNSLLPLMKHFGLCYSGSVIFPTELPAAQPDEVARCWPEVVPSGGKEISVTIEYSQEPPLGLPETMVSRILSMEQTTRRLLTKDTVVVHVGENSEDVMYRHFPTREEIRIRGEPEKAWRQAQTVAKVMEACWDEFPALYFSNNVRSGETTKSLTIEAVRRHVPGDLLRMSEGNWERPLDIPDVRTPEDAIGKYFIDNRLYQVSRAVGEEWTRLGQELGLNRTVLDNISGEYRYIRQDTQQAFQMLKAWRTKTPHGPLHYLPQLEETLQNMGKPDLAAAVQGMYKDYRDALPLQEISPEMTGDTEWSLRLPGEGKYLCRRTDLGVVTPYPLCHTCEGKYLCRRTDLGVVTPYPLCHTCEGKYLCRRTDLGVVTPYPLCHTCMFEHLATIPVFISSGPSACQVKGSACADGPTWAWSLRLPGEGKYLCRRTDLGVVTPYPLHVTYRSANWSDNWQQVGEWMPVGPLFSIQCEDVEGPVDILLPHVLRLNQNTVLNPDAMAIVHVTGETEELLTVSKISPTHLTTRFRKGSKFGPVVRTVLGMSLRRNGLCVVFAPANFASVFQLHVYIISNAVLIVKYLKELEKDFGYSSWDPEQCVLKLGEEYQLEVTAKNGADVDVQTRPEEGLEFDDTFDTGQYYKKFRVEVDARKYSRAQRSRLRFDLHLKNADQTVCRFIPTRGAQALEGPVAADDSDSGVSEPDGTDADTRTLVTESAKRASRDVQRGVELPVTIETLGPTAGPRVVLLHAAEDGEFVRRLVEKLMGQYEPYSLPQTDISCQQVTGTPGDVSRAQLTSTLTLGSVKLVVPVISRHLLADQSSLTVGLETAVRNNKPRYVIWLDQNKDDFREFGTLVSRQYPTLEAPARRVQRDRVEETMPSRGVSSEMRGIVWDVRDALCRQAGELRSPCRQALVNTRVFLADNMNLPAVLTRLEQENQLSPAEVRDIQAEPTPVSRGERLVMMLQDRRRQEPYDWLVRVLREEGQDFLAEEMEEHERYIERLRGIGEQQAAQPGQQTAQREHFTQQGQGRHN
uniref:Death domain-containing protein n=1 Tax=Branchiostoma floridae TaxID=7739 RepID=C3YP50_BRAFL|eukprot:XP_002601929.1 hypothetical protein BRAFLDRAFT_86413 [Branchiostoma floridae]